VPASRGRKEKKEKWDMTKKKGTHSQAKKDEEKNYSK
jgi:hypothetical protein